MDAEEDYILYELSDTARFINGAKGAFAKIDEGEAPAHYSSAELVRLGSREHIEAAHPLKTSFEGEVQDAEA